MAYTSEEVRAAVQSLLLSELRRGFNSLGIRDVGQTFADFQEVTAITLLLQPEGIFYVAYLASQRLLSTVRSLYLKIDELATVTRYADRKVIPVKDITTLANARAALSELASAMASRSSVPKSITSIPAYTRFSSNTSDFVNSQASSIRDGSDIVPTPDEARMRIPALIEEVFSLYATVITRAKFISNLLTNYTNLDLPRVVSLGVIERSRDKIDEIYETLDNLSDSERLAVLRESVLGIAATRAVVKQLGGFVSPTTEKKINGALVPYSDATHTLTRPFIECDIKGPYALTETSNKLSFSLDGATYVVPLGTSYFAEIIGGVIETYEVNLTNNVFRFYVDSNLASVLVSVTLTTGVARTAEQIAADVNAVSAAYDVMCIPRFRSTVKAQATVSVVSTGPTSGTVTVSTTGVDFVALGIVPGDKLVFLNTTNSYYVWTVTARTSTTIDFTGSVAVVAATSCTCQVGASGNFVVALKAINSASIVNKKSIQIDSSVSNTAIGILGFTAGAFAESAPVYPKDVVGTINRVTARIEAAPVFEATYEDIPGRTDATDRTKFIASSLYSEGTITPTGTGLTFVPTDPGKSAIDAGVAAGYVLIVRDGPGVGEVYLVTSVSGTGVVSATGVPPTVAGIGTVDIGFAYPSLEDYEILISSGPLAGSYIVRRNTAVPTFELELRDDTPMATYQDTVGRPIEVVCSIGKSAVSFTSKNETISSSIGCSSGTAFSLLFTTSQPVVNATTKWFRYDASLNSIKVGDVVAYYDTSIQTPSVSYVVTRKEEEVLSLSPEGPANVNMSVSSSATLPFALVTHGMYQPYLAVKTAIDSWLLSIPDDNDLFELERLYNIVHKNSNPTASDVNNAVNKLLGTSGTYELGNLVSKSIATAVGSDATKSLEYILSSYAVEHIPDVDALLRALLQQGCDRAYDLLITADVVSYFGIDMETASYAGAITSSARAVVRETLPTSSTGVGRRYARVIAESESPDYEYTSDDSGPSKQGGTDADLEET